MLNLCDDGHEEICFEGRICPVCASKKEIDDLQRETEELRDKIRELEEELNP